MPRRSPSRRSNLFGLSRRRPTPPCTTRRSDLTIGEALSRAYKAGEGSPDTGLFTQWLCSQGLQGRGAQVVGRLRHAYEAGFEAKMGRGTGRASGGGVVPSDTTRRSQTPSPPPSPTPMPLTRHKGFTIEALPSGGWTTSLERGSEFDSPSDARKFIDRWAKNPGGAPRALVTKTLTRRPNMTAEHRGDEADRAEARKLKAKAARLSGATDPEEVRERKLALALLRFYDQNGRFPEAGDYQLGPVGRNPGGGLDVVDVYMEGARAGRETLRTVGGEWKAWKAVAPEQFGIWWKYHREEVAQTVKLGDARSYWLKGFKKGLEGGIGRNPADRPSIDHGLLSPSGHVSERSRAAAQERVRVELFGPQGLERPTVAQPSEAQKLRQQAADMRELAARGLKPRAYRAEADRLEARAGELEQRSNPGGGAQLADFPEATVRMRQAATPRGGYQSAWGPWHYYADIRDVNEALAGLQSTADFRRVTFTWEVQRKEFGRWGYTQEHDKGRVKPKAKRNPESGADRLYEDFHGRPPEETVIVETPVHEHEHLTALGDLMELKFETLTGLEVTVNFEGQGVLLCSSEDGRQLYFEGGNQSLDLGQLKMGGDEWVRDLMVIGTLTETTYRTQKAFDKFQTIDYYHANGEDTGVAPDLLYDPLSKLMQVAGGQYEVRPEGIVN